MVVTKGFSDQLFVLGAINYLDEDFNINDMGYIEEYNKISGRWLSCNTSDPIKDKKSKVAQTIFKGKWRAQPIYRRIWKWNRI